MRTKFALIFALALAFVSSGFLRGGSGNVAPLFTPAWQNLGVGAGGNAYGIKIYPDGTQLLQNDTYGGHIYNSSGSCVGSNNSTQAAPCWQQLITATSLPAAMVSYTLLGSGNLGLAELVACASNTNVLYGIYTNKVIVSTDRGATWVDANKTITIAGNGGPGNHPRMACDPNNPDVIYAISPSSGTFVSTNGRSGNSATWTTVSAVGTGTGGNGGIIAFDRSSSVSGGFTQRFMICTYGTGCYITTNGGVAGGGSFTLTTSGPTTGLQMICDKFGQFFVVNTTSSVYRYSTTSWTTLSPGVSLNTIDADPTSSSTGTNKLAGINSFSGQVAISTDNGATWGTTTSSMAAAASSPQPTWLAVANQQSGGLPFFSGITVAFDNSGGLWMGAGLGAWYIASPTTSSTTWTANTVGVEQMVINQIISPVGSSPLVAQWDKGFMRLQIPGDYASTYFNNSPNSNCGLAACSPITAGWSIDYAAGSQFVTGVQRSNLDGSYSPASSSDGVSWTRWAGLPSSPDVGGAIAASTSTNWLVVPGQNTALQYTTNGGSSWSASTATGNGGWITNYVNNRQPVAADRSTTGKFYAVDQGLKVFRSTDNGANFSNLGTPFGSDVSVYNEQLITPPPLNGFNAAGHVWLVPGFQPTPTNGHLWKSTDSGATWTCATASSACTGTSLANVAAAGFGFPKPGGGGYPRVYAIGILSSVYGIWKSDDGGSTFAALNVPASQQTWPGNSVDLPTSVSGDSNVYGRAYVCFRGSGCTFIDEQDACPYVNFTNVNSGQSLSGSSVSVTAKHSGSVPVTGVNLYVNGVQVDTTKTGQSTYTFTLNATANAGSKTLKIEAVGNGCGAGGVGNSFSIPVTLSSLTPANDNFPLAAVA